MFLLTSSSLSNTLLRRILIKINSMGYPINLVSYIFVLTDFSSCACEFSICFGVLALNLYESQYWT